MNGWKKMKHYWMSTAVEARMNTYDSFVFTLYVLDTFHNNALKEIY